MDEIQEYGDNHHKLEPTHVSFTVHQVVGRSLHILTYLELSSVSQYPYCFLVTFERSEVIPVAQQSLALESAL